MLYIFRHQIKSNQIKVTMSYYFHPIGWLELKRQIITSVLTNIWKIRTLIHCWLECKMVQLLWKRVWWFFRWLNLELSYKPVFLLLGTYP